MDRHLVIIALGTAGWMQAWDGDTAGFLCCSAAATAVLADCQRCPGGQRKRQHASLAPIASRTVLVVILLRALAIQNTARLFIPLLHPLTCFHKQPLLS
jgi:hypothetical protein